MVLLTTLLQVTGTMLQASGDALGTFAAALGIGIAVISAGYGIGKIGTSAMEAIARQPDAASDIRSSMLLTAAFIEGVALFAVVVCGFIL